MKSRAVTSITIYSAALAAVVITLLIGCNKDLSRDEARRKLIAAKTYPEIVRSYVKIPVGTYWTCQQEALATSPLKEAIDDGLLIGRLTGRHRQSFKCYRYKYLEFEITTELTDKGKALVAFRSEARLKEEPDLVSFRACEIDFGDVTGISMSDDHADAKVDYTERYVRPTAYAQSVSGKCEDGSSLTRTARFTRYDDGWRLRSE